MIWPLKDGHETGTLFLTFWTCSKKSKLRTCALRQQKSRLRFEPSQVWWHSWENMRQHSQKPHGTAFSGTCQAYLCLSLTNSCFHIFHLLSIAILLNTSPISPIDAGILRNSSSQASDFLNLYPTARWGSKRRSFGRSRVAIVGGWWHMVLSQFAAFNGGCRDLEYI